MSIPFKDINAGDSMSSMVDKINYNFDLLSLKGGGVQGVQGIQGIRGSMGEQGIQGVQGVKGTGVIHGNGDPQGASNIDDIYIDDNNGSIWQYTANGWDCIYNPSDSAESPFTYYTPSDKRAIMPFNPALPTVLGGDSSAVANVISQSNTSALNLVGSGSISVFGNGGSNLVARMSVGSGNEFHICNENNIRIGNASKDSVFVILDGNIKVGKYADNTNQGKRVLMTVDDKEGFVGFDTPQWVIAHDGNYVGALYPKSSYDLGYKDNANRIKDIYINPSSVIYLGTIDPTNNDFPKVKTKDKDNNPRTVMGWSQHGVSFGIEATAYTLNFPKNGSNGDTFGIYVGSDKGGSDQSNGYAPYMAMKPASVNIDSANPTIVQRDLIGYINATSSNVAYGITLNSTLNADAFGKDLISPLITIFDDTTKSSDERLLKRMLKIKGHNGSLGSDVLIQGGDSISNAGFDDGNNQFKNVGGNVFISGGGAMRPSMKNGNTFFGDLRNMGNIIIGINPTNHIEMDSTTYGSNKTDEEVSATNPKNVNFFDIADVAIHGNRIVIDSHANQRKLEKYYDSTNGGIVPTGGGSANPSSKGTSGGSGGTASTKVQALSGTPFIESVNNATLQVSALNTMLHTEPILVSAEDIYYNQFLCGVMDYVIGVYNNGNTPEVFMVDNDDFTKLLKGGSNIANSHNPDRLKNSLLFRVHQVWQKVCNVVNVTARCEWFAFNTHENRLYRVVNGMLKIPHDQDPSVPTLIYASFWNSGINAYNETVCRLMGDVRQGNSGTTYYADTTNIGIYNTIELFHKQPMTMLRVPYSVIDNRNMFCYGNGSILTELYTTDEASMSNKTLFNHNVFVGNELSLSSYNSTNEETSLYHSRYGLLDSTKIRASAKDHLDGKTTMMSDGVLAASNNAWGEGHFPKMGISGDKMTYIVPTMLCDWYNKTTSLPYNLKSMLRPVVGLYTAMNLTYSYVVGPQFNDEAFVSFRKVQSNGNGGGTGNKVPGLVDPSAYQTTTFNKTVSFVEK